MTRSAVVWVAVLALCLTVWGLILTVVAHELTARDWMFLAACGAVTTGVFAAIAWLDRRFPSG